MAFQVVAVAILLLFYGCYLLKMVRQRKKGIKTDQMGKGKVGIVKVIELTTKAATYTVFVIELFSILLNTYFFTTSVRIIGALIGVVGMVIFIISVTTMQDNWRAGIAKTGKTTLVTTGIYQISRNPAFLGFDLVYIGVMLMFFNGVLAVATLFAMIMLHLQIVNVEEDFLLETFGEEYLIYQKKVCRYLGRKDQLSSQK